MNYALCILLAFASLTANAQTWKRINSVVSCSRNDDLYFQNEKIGYTINGCGKAFKTVDGGLNWTIMFEQNTYLRSIDFIDNKTGFVGSLAPDIFMMTKDAGATWENIATKLENNKAICGLSHFGSLVFAVGNYMGTGADFYISKDRGITWTHKNLGELADGLINVKFISPKTGFIGGMSKLKGATILRTDNGGENWKIVYQGGQPGDYVWKLSFPSNDVIFGSIYSATDTQSYVVKSINAGTDWVLKNVVEGNKSFEGIGFIDELTGWVGGYSSGMYQTSDGGETWTPISTGKNMNKFFFFEEGNIAYASGAGIFKYSLDPKKINEPKNIKAEHSAVIDGQFLKVSITRNTHLIISQLDEETQILKEIYNSNVSKGPLKFDLKKLQILNGQGFLRLMTHERVFSIKL